VLDHRLVRQFWLPLRLARLRGCMPGRLALALLAFASLEEEVEDEDGDDADGDEADDAKDDVEGAGGAFR